MRATSTRPRPITGRGPVTGRQTGSIRGKAEYEVGVITQMGFPGYFLVVADFINWAKDNGIRVGPGRGSAAGSLVAGVYEAAGDRESAYETLKGRAVAGAEEASKASRAKRGQGSAEADSRDGGGDGDGERGGLSDVLFGSTGPRGGKREGLAETLARSAARTIGSSVGREIIRGVLGGLFGGTTRRRR